MRISIAGPLLLAWGLLWAGPALGADDEEQARIQFERGIELYEAGQFEQAAIAFERAYELKPSFRLLYNLGQAAAEQGLFSRALTAYSRYLAEGGDAVPPERVTAVKAEIERLNALVGVLVLSCPVEGARVTVDGEPWGTTPIASPYLVDVGRHEVLVKKGQDELLRQVVRIAGGQRLELTVEAGEQGASPTPLPPTADADEGPRRVWTWVALGVAAGAGIAGGAIGGASMAQEKDLEADCQDGHCPPGSKGEADKIETMNLTADILYGVAGAAAITALVLFFVEPDDEPAAAPVAVGPGPGPVGLSLQGRF